MMQSFGKSLSSNYGYQLSLVLGSAFSLIAGVALNQFAELTIDKLFAPGSKNNLLFRGVWAGSLIVLAALVLFIISAWTRSQANECQT